MTNSYKDLIVWKKSIELVTLIYEVSNTLPDSEKYGIVSQIRRAAVSIPSNIAEGKRRGSDAEFRRFLQIAYGSGAEVETLIEIIKNLNLIRDTEWTSIDNRVEEVMKMLNKLIYSIK